MQTANRKSRTADTDSCPLSTIDPGVRAGWYPDTSFQSSLIVAAHLDWQPDADAVPSARPQPRRQAPQAVAGVPHPALLCSPSESSGLYASMAAAVPAWQMPCQLRCDRCGGGGDCRMELNHCVINACGWKGDGGSAGTQTFTIVQVVLVNRSGSTKEAGWIIDRV